MIKYGVLFERDYYADPSAACLDGTSSLFGLLHICREVFLAREGLTADDLLVAAYRCHVVVERGRRRGCIGRFTGQTIL